MRIIKSVKPKGKAGKTTAQLADQGYTYNEAGMTYNQAGVIYGGKYGTDVYKMSARVTNRKPSNVIPGIRGIDIYSVHFAILCEDDSYLLTENNDVFQQEH